MKQGSTYHPSILDNVLGPITLGPSSSHLSGPVRLGRLTREILPFAPRQVEITQRRRLIRRHVPRPPDGHRPSRWVARLGHG